MLVVSVIPKDTCSQGIASFVLSMGTHTLLVSGRRQRELLAWVSTQDKDCMCMEHLREILH